jgi:lysophospholipase L1-like esterase
MRLPIHFVLSILLSTLLWACAKNSAHDVSPVLNVDTLPMQKDLHLQPNIGVCIGNSIIAGHPWRYSGLELGILDYPDTFGQISWRLSGLTHFNWFNHGWGGQTTYQIINRFLRDAVGDTSDVGDDRGSVTLPAHSNFAVIEGGFNDISYDYPVSAIEYNLAWMASVCKLNNIRCIVLNCIGQGYNVFDSVQIAKIFALNSWLAGGALDSLSATVIDINSLWNSGTYGGASSYGNDNIHFSSLVDSADGVHFTQIGYDSVAYAIFRVAKLASLPPPKLIRFSNSSPDSLTPP